ncbi:MAG TPA: hypothetical protein DD714_03520, partial [Candidatus Omnitrophica bacterium]|nr:hypothetical protein [Candidatus Omnitrophota bacterium]
GVLDGGDDAQPGAAAGTREDVEVEHGARQRGAHGRSLTGRPGRSRIRGSQRAIESRRRGAVPHPPGAGGSAGFARGPAAQLARDRQRREGLCPDDAPTWAGVSRRERAE